MEEAQLGCGIAFFLFCVILVVIAILVGGTFRTEVSFSPVVVTNASSEISFEEKFTARHWLFGLKKGKQPDFQLALGKYLGHGDQISRISIVTHHSVVNNLLLTITVGIYCPVTVTIRGEIAKGENNLR